MIAALITWVTLLPLVLTPLETPVSSPAPQVYVSQSSGFADYIVGGFVGLGILILFMRWTSRRPKRPS